MKELAAMVLAGLVVQVSQEGHRKWVSVRNSVESRQLTVQADGLESAIVAAYFEARSKGWVR